MWSFPGANMKMREEAGSEQEEGYLPIMIHSYIVRIMEVIGTQLKVTQENLQWRRLECIGSYA